MIYSSTEMVTVYLDARDKRRKLGRLAVKDRRILFEHDAASIASGLEITPVKLPLVRVCWSPMPPISTLPERL
jgi:serine/threonine-protein kinase HipA